MKYAIQLLHSPTSKVAYNQDFSRIPSEKTTHFVKMADCQHEMTSHGGVVIKGQGCSHGS